MGGRWGNRGSGYECRGSERIIGGDRVMIKSRNSLILKIANEDPPEFPPASEVKTYKLTEEELHEIWQKYGPPVKTKKRRRTLTKYTLTKEILARRLHLQQRSINHVAYEFGLPVKLVEKRIQEWGLDVREEEGQCMSG